VTGSNHLQVGGRECFTPLETIARQMFNLAGWILRALPRESDQNLVRSRLAAKLTGIRRGNLKLPTDFPPEVLALTKMTKSQLRTHVWFIKSHDCPLSLKRETVDYIHRVFPGGRIRTVNGNRTVHEWHQKMVKPLSESDWPRLETKPAWPSSPTFSEMLEMGRRGKTPQPMLKLEKVKNHLTRTEFNADVALRGKLIGQQIVGIRSDVKVPRHWLPYFRYRWNFLILTVPYKLPTGLVRFLTGQWIRNPHNLWLRWKCSFKNFLKNCQTHGSTIGPW